MWGEGKLPVLHVVSGGKGMGCKAWDAVVGGVGSVSGSLKLTHLSFHDNVFRESTKVHTYVHNDWHMAVYFWQK